jgi:hypothetical protein
MAMPESDREGLVILRVRVDGWAVRVQLKGRFDLAKAEETTQYAQTAEAAGELVCRWVADFAERAAAGQERTTESRRDGDRRVTGSAEDSAS